MSNRIIESLYRVSGIELTEAQLTESNYDGITCIGMSSEHKDIFDHKYGLPIDEAREIYNITGSRYFTYATFDSPLGKIFVAVVDHHAKNLKFKKYQRPWVVSHPVWTFIANERTSAQQKFIDDHLQEIDKAFKEYIVREEF